MKISTLLKDIEQKLQKEESSSEASWICRILFEDYLRPKGYQLQDEIRADELTDIFEIMKRLLAGEPIQYLVGSAHFFGHDFFVDESVLIPRPETEELVAWILEDRNVSEPIDILDIGSGSGIIPIILKLKMGSASILGLDISESAIRVCKKNADKLNADIKLKVLDFLDQANWGKIGKFDLIVSNPPYIRKSELSEMNPSTAYEPEIALFTDDESGLTFYKHICDFAEIHHKEKISIYIELNEFSAQLCVDYYARQGYEVELKMDMQGKPRMLRARKDFTLSK